MVDLDLIQYSDRMVGAGSPDYDDTLNKALLQVISASGADDSAFVGFALRPTVAPTVGQFYVATDTDVGASWQTLTTSMISDLASAATGITKVGTVDTGVWHGTSIATTYTDAKVKTVTGTTNRLTVAGTATDPTFDIAATYVGQTSITTVGTIATGVWNGTSIGTAYTDAKVVSLTGTSNRLTVGGTATIPVLDIAATYTGQTSIVTLGTVSTGTWTATSIGTAYTDAKVVSITGTASRVTVGGTATVPVIDISASYVGQSSITTLGTVTTGVWNGTSITTTYTDAKLKTLTGTLNRLTVGGTATDPTVDISVSYVGQATITTLGTIATGTWQGTSIATTYTDAKIASVTGTLNRITIGGTATAPTFDISTSYVGQATITTLGTIATGTWAATTISVDKGGTGLTSYAIGDTLYASSGTTLSKLAGNTTTQAQVLMQTGTGAASQAPVWHTLVTADITDLTSASTGITKLGTVTTGVWNAGIISGIYGGTGVNNGSSTITLAGNLVTVGAFSLTLTTTAGTNVTLPTTGTLVNTAVTSLASLTSVGGAFAISGAFTGATTGVFSSTVTASSLIVSAAAGTLVPGATSFSLRNNANNADNILISDAGAITVRSTISGVTTISGTTATFTNLGGTLSTASQPNVTTVNGQTISSAASFTGTMTVATSITVTTAGITVASDAGITYGARGAIKQDGSFNYVFSTNSVANAFQVNVGGGATMPNASYLAGTRSGGGTYRLIGLDANDHINLGANDSFIVIVSTAVGNFPAGGATMNGVIGIDSTNNRLVYYSGGNRYFIAGTAF
jgi:hypothetical protein